MNQQEGGENGSMRSVVGTILKYISKKKDRRA
jgi:hypothetical protein